MKDAVRTRESTAQPGAVARGDGVGGRQAESQLSTGWVGTRVPTKNRATRYEKKHDPKLDEILLIGLPRVWASLAAAIGVDNCLEVWRVLDQHVVDSGADERLLRVPTFKIYLRFQRNRYIVALDRQGIRPKEIEKMVKKVLCERIGPRHIARIIAKHRMQL